MICELFPFQKQAVNEMRLRVAMALNNYRMLKIPQVVSLQAPTGSGKTIIMSALIEDIFYGSEQFTEQPEAIFVWLSDSPQLNEQSKQKIELKADKIRMDQCVVISDESFDREILEDGHIYFLNTQKLGKAGNLSRHSDTRQYTIWETIENTAREKADRLYFIIDEAHRGMQGRQAGTATTIMQRFIKGSSEQNLLPIPVVIGMSATAERFNSLVGQATNSTLHKVIISPAQVRQSGLLKDRIVITYPEDPIKHGDMAVLQAATDEWQDKCKHWYQYTYEQHYTNVNPVFVIQVCAGSGTKVSDTDLDDVIAKIEERMGDSFKENEVVHTFGSTGTLSIHGLTVPHIEPSEIAEDRRIRVVLFKENLSTGWDCPRAETMMSFRRAEDATYIAQLLGRMVRTPLQCHVLVDDSLNDVRLFLPYFNQDTVQKVIDELQATEGGEIPTVVDGESLEEQNYDTWSVHNQRKKTQKLTVGQLSIFDYPNGFQEEPAVAPSTAVGDMPNSGVVAVNQGRVDNRTEELPTSTLRSIKPFLPPELIIQDELHLITGPLGTVYGAYETVIEDLCSYTIGEKKIKPKYVVSTATIKNAAEQTKCLYGRKVTAQFPPNGFEIGDSFYIREVPVEQDPFRRYVGVCAPGQSVKTALLRVYSIILQSAYNLSLDDEYKDVIDPYYTLVGYYNSIRELGGAVRLLQDDIPDRIQRIKKKYGMSRQRFLNHKVEITSRMSSYDIPKKLSQLETPYTDRNCLDTAIATNMIAVGMDVDRLGLMVVTGQPKQNSEYIQATSRIGRSYPGLVVTLYNPYRPRDLSHYENFTGYHAQLYRFVEGTTATPFSARARDRVLHALVISAIRLHYPEFASNDGAAAIDKLTDEQLNEVKALIMNRLNIIKPSAKADAEHEIDDFISNWKLLATQSKELRYYVYTTKTYNRLMNTYGEVCTDLEKPTLRSMRDVERAANMFYYTED